MMPYYFLIRRLKNSNIIDVIAIRGYMTLRQLPAGRKGIVRTVDILFMDTRGLVGEHAEKEGIARKCGSSFDSDVFGVFDQVALMCGLATILKKHHCSLK
jgi:hypothetical protein